MPYLSSPQLLAIAGALLISLWYAALGFRLSTLLASVLFISAWGEFMMSSGTSSYLTIITAVLCLKGVLVNKGDEYLLPGSCMGTLILTAPLTILTLLGRQLYIHECFYTSAGNVDAPLSFTFMSATMLMLVILAALVLRKVSKGGATCRLSGFFVLLGILCEGVSWVTMVRGGNFVWGQSSLCALILLGTLATILSRREKKNSENRFRTWERYLAYSLMSIATFAVIATAVLAYRSYSLISSSGLKPPEVLNYKVHASLVLALVSAEDLLFFSHRGVDLARLKQVTLKTIETGRYTRGASTLSMQLAKILFLPFEKTIIRKLEQLCIALILERLYTKEELLRWYFSVISLAPNSHGMFDGSYFYYSKPPLELSEQQEARLILAIPDPSNFNPATRSEGRGPDKRMLALVRTMRTFENALSPAIDSLSFVAEPGND